MTDSNSHSEQSYFDTWAAQIGLLPEQRQVMLKWGNDRQSKLTDVVFEDEDGNICFLVYDLDGFVITHDSGGDPSKVTYKSRNKDLVVKRLKVPKQDKEGREQKYQIPKGAGTRPFIPPALMKKFHEGTPITSLIATEGYKKALCGSLYGFDIVGLPSITAYKDKKTQTLHEDVLRIITERQVQNFILLYDGDARKISEKALSEGKDIYLRPAQFFSSASNIRELVKDHLGVFECDLYYAEINSAAVKGDPKGFDDLIVAGAEQLPLEPPELRPDDPFGRARAQAMQEWAERLKKDLFSFSKPGNYFTKFNITHSVSKLRGHMHITSVADFYGFHNENPYKIADKEFIYLGTKYRFDSTKGECEVIIPGAAKDYFRAGTRFYRRVEIPDKYGNQQKSFHLWEKTTIKDDHGANFLNHIPKYVAFCNVPDHVNYQTVIHNCYNVYYPFEHLPEEGDCSKTLNFLTHIFDEQIELGLDYLQLLYQRPTQILPILCLVSRQNNTGKTTFAKWLKAIFTQNMVIVGNAELQNDFNASWATRLLICCEESFIDKKVVTEKIKALATADTILMNAKGKDHVEMNFLGKFVFLSNNEENFIHAGEDDIRYWVRKIPVPKDDNVKLLSHMVDEIPCFLDFLSKRKMSTELQSRMWFSAKLLETEALRKVRMASRPTIEKELRMKLREYFLDFGEERLMMTLPAIKQEFFRNKYEDNFLRRILVDNLKVDQYYQLVCNGDKYEPWALPPGVKAEDCQKQYCTHRSSYHKREYQLNGTEQTREYVMLEVKENGKPYVFHQHHYVSENDIALHLIEHDVGVVEISGGGGIKPAAPITDPQRKLFKNMTKELPNDPTPDMPF